MADPTTVSEALTAMLSDYVAQQNGFVTGLVGMATFIDGDGEAAYIFLADSNQGPQVALGIFKMLEVYGTALATSAVGITPLRED